MTTGLLQHLDLPRSHIANVLNKLASEGKVNERKKDLPLLEHLESLDIVRCDKQLCRWYVDNMERLLQISEQLAEPDSSKPKVHRSILRSTDLVHRKCAAAWRGDSKSRNNKPLLPGQQVTNDDVIRLRSRATGLSISYHEGWCQCVDDETRRRTECVVPERLWLAKRQVTFKNIRLVMTVENLGAFVDLPLVDGLVLLYVPGLNLSSSAMLQVLPEHVPWVAFPDYDPNGLSIICSMAKKIGRPCRVWLPDYWRDQAEQRSREMAGNDKRAWSNAPALNLPGLRDQERWLEQETLVLDHRCNQALLTLVNNGTAIQRLQC